MQINPELDALLARPGGLVHLVGVCGVGMAGVAVLLRSRGFGVSGCDAAGGRMADWLAARGVDVQVGHSPQHMAAAPAWAIRTPAVPETHPEIAAADALGIPVFRRGEVLPALLRGTPAAAVGGTHGKTTTSSFVAQLLHFCGRAPGWCIGGEVGPLGGVAGAGQGGPLVVEADESDGTLALYAPTVAVITNIEFDHMEHFDGVAALEACFQRFAQQAGRVFYCRDDERATRICAALAHAVSYGFHDEASVRAVDVAAGAASSAFTMRCGGQDLGRVHLPVPGAHNVLNATAALATAMAFGVSFADAAAALERVELPRRRFETVAESGGVRVISDYGHHPTEIAALVRTAHGLGARRLLAVFQPHRYTRTRTLGPDFPAAFAGIDDLVLTPVYAASEPPLEGGLIGDLYERFREHAATGQPGAGRVRLARSLDEAWQALRRELRPGDLFLIIGAGDVERIAQWAAGEAAAAGRAWPLGGALPVRELARSLPDSRVRAHEPLAPKTGLRVGGRADIWVSVGSVGDLARLGAWTRERGLPLTLLGGGFNVLVSDLGVRGVTARLSGKAFRGLARVGDAIVAGAAVPIARLLDGCEAQGCAGLEFMEGIPGTVGGAMRMNAGAWRHAIGERLLWIRCLKNDGIESIVSASDCGLEYRECRVLDSAVLLEAAFRFEPGDAAAIGAARAEIARKRAWMDGLRSAGSMFRNPANDYAGRLLEEAGFKGAALGGAAVTATHANLVFTRQGATASDVRALVERMQSAVERRTGVRLQMEVMIL